MRVLLCVVVMVGWTCALDTISVSPSNAFVDAQGRTRLFHGINAVNKQFPWYPTWLANESYVEEIASWGVNLVRVGWMWTGFEPASGQFNESYFEAVKDVVDILAARGIYTLLDAHQDILSSKFCLYDGVPQWVIAKSTAVHPFPWPLSGACSSRPWQENAITEAAAQAYQDLYTNTNGMRDDITAFWRQSAKRWSSSSSVIGYELLNEPFPGNVFNDTTLLKAGVAERDNLGPFYDALTAGIRTYDPAKIVFYEPANWGLLKADVFDPGFVTVPGGEQYASRSALSFHYYCGDFVIPQADPEQRHAVCDLLYAPELFKSAQATARRLGGATLMTEFGYCVKESQLDECNAAMDLADALLLSWTEYDGWEGGDSPPSFYVDTIARPYARAIGGTAINMTFDRTSKDFEVCYTTLEGSALQTVLFIPLRVLYQSGVHVTVTDNAKFTVDKLAQEVYVSPAGGTPSGETVCVWVTR